MEKTSLTYIAFKNSSWSMLGYIWSIIFTLIVTPIIVFEVGIKEYGIYLFINTVMSLFGLLDIGLGVAVTKQLSFYFGKKDENSMRRLIRSANFLFFVIGATCFLLSLLIALLGVELLPIYFSAYEKYSNLFILAGGTFFFSTIIASYNAIFYATQRFDMSNKIGIASVTISSLLMLGAVLLGWSILGIFIVQFLTSIVISAFIYFRAVELLPLATFRFAWHKKEVLECYKFGLIAYINNMASVALASLDRLVIPFFVGPSNLTYYSMPGNITAKIPSITNTLTISMLPTTAQLVGSDENSRMKTLYVRSFRLMIVIAGAFTVTAISFSYQILQYWLSIDFADRSAGVLVVLALTNFLLALFGPLSSFLLGLNKLKFLAISSICMAVLNAVALFTLLPKYGIIGAAWAYLISVFPIIYIFYYVETRYLNLTNKKQRYLKTIAGTGFTAILVLIFNFFTSSLILSLLGLLLAGFTSVIVYVILYRLFGFFDEEDWKDIEYFSSILLKKLRINLITHEK